MMKWGTSTIDEIASIVGGGTPTRNNPDYYGGTIPWVTPKDMKSWEITGAQIAITQSGLDNSATRLIPPDSVLIVVRSGVLKHTIPVGLNRLPVAINQDMKALQCREGVDADYIAHFIKAQSPTILQWVRATTADNFPIDNLRKLSVPLPPYREQKRIAEILDKAEALRAKRRAALVQLDTLTQAIFLEMFGDPVQNQKRWPNPTLGGLLTFQQYGPRFYNESYSLDGTPIVRITDLDEGGNLDFASMPRLKISKGDLAKYELKPGDIIFARTGATVGKVALILEDDPQCVAGAYFITMRFDRRVHPLYVRTVLNMASIRDIVARRSRQAAQQNFSGPGLRKLPMPVPPETLQNSFVQRVGAVQQQKRLHQSSLTKLDALFASLQQRAFRGEV